MPKPPRRLPITALLALGIAALIGYAVGVYSRPQRGPDELPAWPGERDECRHRDAELERKHDVLARRYSMRVKAVRELLLGRLTLGQAAVLFRDVERELPVTWELRPSGGPGESQRLCREVIDWAQNRVAEVLPTEAAAVAARLEAELEQLRGPDGVVRLPD